MVVVLEAFLHEEPALVGRHHLARLPAVPCVDGHPFCNSFPSVHGRCASRRGCLLTPGRWGGWAPAASGPGERRAWPAAVVGRTPRKPFVPCAPRMGPIGRAVVALGRPPGHTGLTRP